MQKPAHLHYALLRFLAAALRIGRRRLYICVIDKMPYKRRRAATNNLPMNNIVTGSHKFATVCQRLSCLFHNSIRGKWLNQGGRYTLRCGFRVA